MNRFPVIRRSGRLAALAVVVALLWTMSVPAFAAGLELSTSYPGISARAGETLTFSLDLTNSSGSGCTVTLTEASAPEGWEGYFTGNGGEISQVYAKSGENMAVADYSVTVPSDAAEGDYTVRLQASGGGMSSQLTLTLHVTTQETGSSAITAEYPDQEGTADASFSFNVTVRNSTAAEQSYSLSAQTPTGWTATFKPSGESTQVAAITVDAGSTQNLTVEVTAPTDADAGEYTIPITAASGGETLSTELSVTISGSYDLALSTPSGLLSFDATANKAGDVTLSLTNAGNVDLQNINLTTSAPTGWTVTFSESTIGTLEAGATKEVTMTVTPASDAMSGDYVLGVTASGGGGSDTAQFRVTVKTSTGWGILGVLLLLIAAGALWAVFRKYGRR